MNCPVCKGELEPKEGEITAGLTKVKYHYFKCSKCKEELVFEDESKKAFHEIASAQEKAIVKKRIGYAGNSLILRIPGKLAKTLKIRKGTKVEIMPKKKGFIVVLE